MKQAGEKALNDPEVQKAIIDAAKTYGPEVAAAAVEEVKKWANDPATQAMARHYAGMAMGYVFLAGSGVVGCIEQGPAGVRFLAFGAGTASMVISGLDVINLANLVNPVKYVIALYQALFSLTTMLFEAPPDWVAKVPGVDNYQNMLIGNARLLTLNLGRGLFYIFQGSLWLVLATWLHFFHVGAGLALCLFGVIHVLMHFGVMPQHVAAKMRAIGGAAAAQYQPVSQADPAHHQTDEHHY